MVKKAVRGLSPIPSIELRELVRTVLVEELKTSPHSAAVAAARRVDAERARRKVGLSEGTLKKRSVRPRSRPSRSALAL